MNKNLVGTYNVGNHAAPFVGRQRLDLSMVDTWVAPIGTNLDSTRHDENRGEA